MNGTFARTLLALSSAVALAAPLVAQAQDLTPMQQYRQDRAACVAGNTHQDKATCLYEARSVLRDLRMGKVLSDDPQKLADNSVLRCERVPADTKSACERLARGEGERDGSVAQGAVVMWLAEADTTMVSEAPQLPQ